MVRVRLPKKMPKTRSGGDRGKWVVMRRKNDNDKGKTA